MVGACQRGELETKVAGGRSRPVASQLRSASSIPAVACSHGLDLDWAALRKVRRPRSRMSDLSEEILKVSVANSAAVSYLIRSRNRRALSRAEFSVGESDRDALRFEDILVSLCSSFQGGSQSCSIVGKLPSNRIARLSRYATAGILTALNSSWLTASKSCSTNQLTKLAWTWSGFGPLMREVKITTRQEAVSSASREIKRHPLSVHHRQRPDRPGVRFARKPHHRNRPKSFWPEIWRVSFSALGYKAALPG
jgi:hypothetical protein